jgi:hypothetical protein
MFTKCCAEFELRLSRNLRAHAATRFGKVERIMQLSDWNQRKIRQRGVSLAALVSVRASMPNLFFAAGEFDARVDARLRLQRALQLVCRAACPARLMCRAACPARLMCRAACPARLLVPWQNVFQKLLVPSLVVLLGSAQPIWAQELKARPPVATDKSQATESTAASATLQPARSMTEAATQVQNQSGGKILSIRRIQSRKGPHFRVKLLTVGGSVRVVNVPEASASAAVPGAQRSE